MLLCLIGTRPPTQMLSRFSVHFYEAHWHATLARQKRQGEVYIPLGKRLGETYEFKCSTCAAQQY